MARDDVCPEIAGNSSQNTLSGSTSSPRISALPQVEGEVQSFQQPT